MSLANLLAAQSLATTPIRRASTAARHEQASPSIEALIGGIARDRDRDCFATLFTQLAPKVKAYMMRYGALDTVAEDLAQDVFLTLWRTADQFDLVEQTGLVWIYAISRDLRVQRLGTGTLSTSEPISPWRPIFGRGRRPPLD